VFIKVWLSSLLLSLTIILKKAESIFYYGRKENFEKVDFSKSLRRTLPKFPSEIAIMQSSQKGFENGR